MRFAIGIPAYNGAQRVDYLLESIDKFYSRAKEVEILVSDDCSPQGEETEKVCQRWGVKYTQPDEWKCVGGNTNHLINSLDADIIGVIQDDILISRGSIEVMEQFWEDNRWLRLGAVGWTYFQAWELAQVGILPSRDKFYPPSWNNGEIKRNDYTLIADPATGDLPVHPQPNDKPYLKPTPSGVAFTISKLAWEDCAGFYEFGMFEGGMFHEMWERGWINLIIPTPPILHGHMWATEKAAGPELHQHIKEHPEKKPSKHPLGEDLYKKLRGRYYSDDHAYINSSYIEPFEAEILSLIKYRFDVRSF